MLVRLMCRTKQYSKKYAAVVKFSRARKRYERQGLLVEASALQQAENEISAARVYIIRLTLEAF